MEAADGDDRRSKRVRRAAEVACESTSSNERTGSSTSGRPTSSELQEALTVIKQMKEADPPLLARRAPAKPNVVACAIALWLGEQFADDRAALRIFGAQPETKIREAWVSNTRQESGGWSHARVPTLLIAVMESGTAAAVPLQRWAEAGGG